MNQFNKDITPDQLKQMAFDVYMRNTPDLLFLKDANLIYVDISDTFARILGSVPKQLIGKSDFEIFPEELARKYTTDDKTLLSHGEALVDYVEPLPMQDGKKRYSSTSKYILKDENGNITGLFGVGRDVTAQVELQEERERRALSTDLFADVLEGDLTENKVLWARGSVWSRGLPVGISFTEAVSHLASHCIHPDYAGEFRKLYHVQRLLDEFHAGRTEFSHITYQTENGIDYRWMEYQTKLYDSQSFGTMRITTFIKDLDDQVKSQNRLRKQASTDHLTGLLNREAIFDKINNFLSGDGAKGTHLLLFLDLDYFKQVNDNFGHHAGDQMLQMVAKKLMVLFRKDDFVGRIGGDEFLIFLKNLSSEKEVSEKFPAVFDSLSFRLPEQPDMQPVTCSVGAAIYKGDGKPLEQLYQEADASMYRAKEGGRNRTYFSF